MCVFASGLGDRGSIPGRVIPKTLEMARYTSLINTQQYTHYGKNGAILRKEYRPPLHLGVVAIEKGTFDSSSTTVANFILLLYTIV